ncbi:MAG TPA: hypothetical protein VII45_10220 [Solirubrobacterales bacterium]
MNQSASQKGGHGKELKVTVFAPRSPEGKKFKWNEHMTVGAAADEAAKEFGYAQGTPTLAKHGSALDRDKELTTAGVRDGDKLELVDIGGGV